MGENINTERSFRFDWFSHHTGYWPEALKRFEGKDSLNFMELGVFEGRATTYLLDNYLKDSKGSKIVCIDTFKGTPGEHDKEDLSSLLDTFKRNVRGYEDKVQIHVGKTKDILLLPEVRSEKYDLIYVDACHLAKEVLEDMVFSFGLLKPGGLMIIDDYLWPSPNDVYNKHPAGIPYLGIESFLKCYVGRYNLLWQSYQVCIEKLGDELEHVPRNN
tara:strand:+ start:549 stop:1196 length:648 start_codon:yes stop_codon:yes gene_type:complete